MEKTFKDAMISRRSYYLLGAESTVADQKIIDILETALYNLPSAFNSQTTRIVLLLGDNHKELWNITKGIIKGIVPETAFAQTENKINNSFASGYGTLLFYEDTDVVEVLQKSFPTYADMFPGWSEQTSGIHQFAVWTMLEQEGLGASLQHYNPLIDDAVAKRWDINPKWKLVAQMPFGKPLQEPKAKSHEPIDKRLVVFK